jgi:hypothetical protein
MSGTCSTFVEEINKYKVLVGKPRERNNLEDPGADGSIILKYVFKK